jgi:hypothetical protein
VKHDLVAGSVALVELLHHLEDHGDYREVLLFRRTMIGPRQVLNMGDFSLLFPKQELPLDQVWHDRLHANQFDIGVIELNDILDLHRPVMITFLLSVFLGGCQHDNEVHMLLLAHAPEILSCLEERPLSRNEELVISTCRRIDEVRVDVRVINVFIPLHEADAGVLDCEIYQLGDLQGLSSLYRFRTALFFLSISS